MNFSDHKPIRIITGYNCVAEAHAEITKLGKKALVVSGKTSADKSGAYADISEVLDRENIEHVRFAAIPENPPAPLCFEAGKM